jgi:hypothetical protein
MKDLFSEAHLYYLSLSGIVSVTLYHLVETIRGIRKGEKSTGHIFLAVLLLASACGEIARNRQEANLKSVIIDGNRALRAWLDLTQRAAESGTAEVLSALEARNVPIVERLNDAARAVGRMQKQLTGIQTDVDKVIEQTAPPPPRSLTETDIELAIDAALGKFKPACSYTADDPRFSEAISRLRALIGNQNKLLKAAADHTDFDHLGSQLTELQRNVVTQKDISGLVTKQDLSAFGNRFGTIPKLVWADDNSDRDKLFGSAGPSTFQAAKTMVSGALADPKYYCGRVSTLTKRDKRKFPECSTATQ